MTQISLGVSVSLPSDAKEKCVFCDKDHQDEKASSSKFGKKNTKNLKKKGQGESKENSVRLGFYLDIEEPPLVDWGKKITPKGYKAAAHHCLAYKCVVEHKIQGELKDAGYDPDGGHNCILLPYSNEQFSRARALGKPMQKHSGGHTNNYFSSVDKHLDKIANLVNKKFCSNNQKATKEKLCRYAEIQENVIWYSVARPKRSAYQLYNASYRDPEANWGVFDKEKNHTIEEYLKIPVPVQSDNNAESINEDDPE